MKVVIVEIHRSTAIVLSEEGCIAKIRNRNYQIGQEVEIQVRKELKQKKWFAFASAAASLLFLSGIGAYAYYTPYTYVSLDVNPSIEYTVNRFEKVLSVNGVNDDGTEIISEISLKDLKYKRITDAVALTVNEILKAGYLDSGTSGIVITTSSEKEEEADDLAKVLEASAVETCEDNDCKAVVTAESVGAKRVAEARELGVTPGKLNLVQKLIESSGNSEDIELEEWLHKSVKDIMAQTKEYKKEEKEDTKPTKEDAQSETQTEESDDTPVQIDPPVQKESLSENSVNKKTESDKKPHPSVSSNSVAPDSAKQQSEKSEKANGNSNSKKEKTPGSSSSNSNSGKKEK